MISICTAYKNRKKQLIQTLKSISHSAFNDYEMIIVDDGSSEEHRIEELEMFFGFVRVIRIEPEDKTWINPCIPYNIAFKEAKGDKIIIQNPECAHVGDVLSYVNDNLAANEYMSFSCLSWSHLLTEKYCDNDYFGKNDLTELRNIAFGLGSEARYDGDLGWYNHLKYIARGLHFCNAINTNDLKRLGGFDERFADGFNFDDNELVWRVTNAGIPLKFVIDPFVLHLYHYTDCSTDENPDKTELVEKNYLIFQQIQNGELPLWSGNENF